MSERAQIVAWLPDYIDLFRIIRRAGRSDAAKARAVYDALTTCPHLQSQTQENDDAG